MFNKDKIKDELGRRGWTESKLANKSKIARSTLNEIINGKNTNPKVDTIFKISEAFEIPMDYFFDRGNKSGVVVVEKKIPATIKKVEDAMMKMNERDQDKIFNILNIIYEDYF